MNMNKIKTEDTTIIASIGKGYDWFEDTAKENLMLKLDKEPEAIVVFNLGVNDLENARAYADSVNNLAERYPSTRFVYMSVTPVEETEITNGEIEDFNRILSSALKGVEYLDAYTYLQTSGFRTTDGLHYTDATTNRIYKFIKEQTGENNEAGEEQKKTSGEDE